MDNPSIVNLLATIRYCKLNEIKRIKQYFSFGVIFAICSLWKDLVLFSLRLFNKYCGSHLRRGLHYRMVLGTVRL